MDTGSDTVTQGIRVIVEPHYLPAQSAPDEGKYAFGYRVTISNIGERRAKLVERHWIIVDGDGERHETGGPGVVGHTPDLAPGETFTYESFCPLPTEWGTMEGSYTMQREDGVRFDAAIGRFFLVMPRRASATAR